MYSIDAVGRHDIRLAALRVKRHLRTLGPSPRARRDAARAITAHRAAMAASFRQAVPTAAPARERLCRRSATRMAA